METLTHFLDEISIFEKKLNKVLIEAYYNLFEINEILSVSPSSSSTSSSSDSSSNTNPNWNSNIISGSDSSSGSSSISSSTVLGSSQNLKKNEITIKNEIKNSDLKKNENQNSDVSAIISLLRALEENIPELKILKNKNKNNDKDKNDHAYDNENDVENKNDIVKNVDKNNIENINENIESNISTLYGLVSTTFDFLFKFYDTFESSNVINIEEKNRNDFNDINNNNNNNNNINNNVNNINNKNRNIKKKSESNSDNFERINNFVINFDNNIIDLRKDLELIGFKETNLDLKFKNLQDYFQEIKILLNKAEEEMKNINNYLPLKNTKNIINKLQLIKIESDNLFRKHNINYLGLQNLRNLWIQDLSLMNDLIFTIPEAEKTELKLRKEYTEIAFYLTNFRVFSAFNLINRVNNLLPELEMRDKKIGINFNLNFEFDNNNCNSDFSKLVEKENENDYKFNSNDINDEENNYIDEYKNDNGDVKQSLSDCWKELLLSGNINYNENKNDNDKSGHKIGEKTDTKNDEKVQFLINNLSKNLLPFSPITNKGWDDVSLYVRPYRENKNKKDKKYENNEKEEMFGNKIKLDRSMEPLCVESRRDVITININDINDGNENYHNNNDNNNNNNDNGNNNANNDNNNIDISALSSGESTRLALALETCTYVSTNMKANENNEIISDSLDTSSPHISRGSVSGSNNEENNNDQSSSNNDSRGDSNKNIKFSDNDSNSSYDNNNKNGNAKEIINSSQISLEPEQKQESGRN